MKKKIFKIFKPLLIVLLVNEARKIKDTSKRIVVMAFLECMYNDNDVTNETLFH